MGYPHIKWPSFQNIHRQINDISDSLVIVTEKIDGSNLGVELHDGNIVALHSRNVTIWHKDMDKPLNPDMSFQKNKLSFLKIDLDKFKNFWTVNCNNPNMTVTLFGEVFNHKFYPFGFARRYLDGVLPIVYHSMTVDTWKLLNTMGFTPPRLLIPEACLLSHAIETIHEEMLRADKNFEGVFITFHDQNSFGLDNPVGLKYKTGLFEEQPGWNVDDSKIKPEFEKTVERMREVYSNKSKPDPVKTVKTGPRPEAIPIIELAWNSVLSKEILDPSEMKTQMSKSVPKMIKLVTEEIKKTYSELTPQAQSEALSMPTTQEISMFVSNILKNA